MSSIYNAFRNSPLVRRFWGDSPRVSSPTICEPGPVNRLSKHHGAPVASPAPCRGHLQSVASSTFVSPPSTGAAAASDVDSDASRLAKTRSRRHTLRTQPKRQCAPHTSCEAPSSPKRLNDYSAPSLRVNVSPPSSKFYDCITQPLQADHNRSCNRESAGAKLQASEEAAAAVQVQRPNHKRKRHELASARPANISSRLKWADEHGMPLIDSRWIENCLDEQDEELPACGALIREGKDNLRHHREQDADQRDRQRGASVPANVRKVQEKEFERIRNEIASATQSLLQKNAKLKDAISSKQAASEEKPADKFAMCNAISDRLIAMSQKQDDM